MNQQPKQPRRPKPQRPQAKPLETTCSGADRAWVEKFHFQLMELR